MTRGGAERECIMIWHIFSRKIEKNIFTPLTLSKLQGI